MQMLLKKLAQILSALKIWLLKLKLVTWNFDVVIASPDAMRIVGQLGTHLGTSWSDANPKVGTVASNVAEAVKMQSRSNLIPYR